MSYVKRPRSPDERPPSGDGITSGRIQRTAPLVALTVRTAAEAVAAGVHGKLTGADSAEFHERTAERYAELLGRSKGALMKAGQLLACTLAGPAVPPELRPVYEAALGRLRSDAPPMAPELSREALKRSLGLHAENAFAEFDWKSLAAASIGQVHRAQLRDGRAVAVKIQYPGVAEAIGADLRNTELLVTFLSLAIGGMSPRRARLDVRGFAREIRTHLMEELDYRLEAANQAEFAERYRGHPFIHVPDVIPELCTDRVLTQELVQGLSWKEALAAEEPLRKCWAEAIYRFYLGSYRRFRLFNADPHPGNFLFHDDGSVSFLDFGCVKRLRRDQADMMNAILSASRRGDALGTWRASVEAGFWRSTDPVTPEQALAWWRRESSRTRGSREITPTTVTRWIARRYSWSGPSANALRYATPPPDCSIMERLALGVHWAIAQLRTSLDLNALEAEHFEHAPPLTAMGKLEHAFFAQPRSRGGSL